MSNPLDVTVSCFKNCTTPNKPYQVNLLSWLRSKKYLNRLIQFRSEVDLDKKKKLKLALPLITPSGTFSYKSEQSLLTYTRLMQFDIDKKENVELSNFAELKTELRKIKNIAYCGHSASGKGYWGLVSISNPERFKDHFRALLRDFKTLGINIDHQPCNPSSGRIYSYDPEAYFNHTATVYKRFLQPQKKGIKPFKNGSERLSEPFGEDEETVQELIEPIIRAKTDITNSYADWFQIAAALANVLGEDGRQYFHDLSQFHEKYNYNEAERLFDKCVQKSYNYGMGTLVYLCKKL